MQNNSVFPILHCFFLFHIQMFSLLLVHSMKGLLTCNSCSTQSSSSLTVVYNTLNESQFLFFSVIFLKVISSYLSYDSSESEVLASTFQSVQII